jgi:hypothetical protein
MKNTDVRDTQRKINGYKTSDAKSEKRGAHNPTWE